MAKNTETDAVRYGNTLIEIMIVFVVGLVYVTMQPANIIEHINNVYGNMTVPALTGIKNVLGYALLTVISFVFGVLNYVIVGLVSRKINKSEVLAIT